MSDVLVGFGHFGTKDKDTYKDQAKIEYPRGSVLWGITYESDRLEEKPCTESNPFPAIYNWLPNPRLNEASRQVYQIVDIPPVRAAIVTRTVLDIQIPQSLWHIADVIENSRWILKLEDDWDGEGSPAYSQETWERAVRFLLVNALALWEDFRIPVDVPGVHNGPEGSIDIYWKTQNGSLLINVSPENKEAASFYAGDKEGHEIKGTLSLNSENHWLLLWQTRKR